MLSAPNAGVGLTVSAFEHLDDVIADSDGIQETLEVKCKLLNVHHAQVI